MKRTKRFTVLLLILMVVICAVSLTACNHKQNLNPEERPFSMSISTPDGVFNPFFSTSGYDSSIISLTQIGMINTDANGKPIVGENEPTVAKDYTVQEASDQSSTTYEFLIKKGIKFSDGVELTIKDVLFNLYVYLDPVYTGAATIYSTDIKGLKNYRMQTLNDVTDSGSSSFESGFVTDASRRIDEDVDFIKTRGTGINNNDRPPLPVDYDTEQGVLDFAFIAKTFYEELSSDWNAINVEDYEDWKFTEKWQIFFMNDGGDSYFLQRQWDGGPYVKDDDGNYQLDEEYASRFYIDQIGPALVDAGLATRNGDNFDKTGSDEDIEKAIKNYCVKAVFTSMFTTEFPMSVVESKENKVTLTEDEKVKVNAAIDRINVNDFETIAKFWGTASTVLDRFTAEAKTEYFKTNTRLVPTISGITTHKTTMFNGKTLDSEYDVLRIEINGVDPKAIYNFGFIVAPMHYYSSSNWNGHNYIEEFDAETGHFGLEFGNSDFMNEVINSSDKIGLPIGAGPYMACSESGSNVTADSFFNLNIVYYERNPYFYTTGENIENAKIKYVRYKVVESDQILNSLISGNIDFGEPNAKKDVEDELSRHGLIPKTVTTNGYGYVGINPRFVPDVNIRRAIMKALNASRIMDDYYKGGFGEELYRPMTSYSWAYPQGVGVYKSRSASGIGIPETDYSYDGTGYTIEELVIAAGYTKVGGVYERTIPGFGVDRLDYKFTIAGGSKDHPAYKMFLDAAQLLNSIGFDVKVVTSQNALTDLGAGKLEVWAAAWSSTVDPDMFQVYHRDSQASSVKNWGYPQILGQTNPNAWGDEYEIVVELSDMIDRARSVTSDTARAPLYHSALDLVMELAVEFPTYQRKDLFAYQNNMIDPSTLPENVTPYSGLLARIWEINYL